MQFSDLDLNKSYTYADYLKWQFEERVELIKGKIFKMSPAPNFAHQKISMNISGMFWSFLKGKNCQVITAPFDVKLMIKGAKNQEIITIVQPDVCVICDETKIDSSGCNGAPDLVVEILSPSNNKKELKNKYEIYEEAGVQEYWVVFPPERAIQIFTLHEGKYSGSRYFFAGDQLTSGVLPGFSVDAAEVFTGLIDEVV